MLRCRDPSSLLPLGITPLPPHLKTVWALLYSDLWPTTLQEIRCAQCSCTPAENVTKYDGARRSGDIAEQRRHGGFMAATSNKLSGKFPMGLGIPPLKFKIMLESNPLTSRIVVRRLAVAGLGAFRGHLRAPQDAGSLQA